MHSTEGPALLVVGICCINSSDKFLSMNSLGFLSYTSSTPCPCLLIYNFLGNSFYLFYLKRLDALFDLVRVKKSNSSAVRPDNPDSGPDGALNLAEKLKRKQGLCPGVTVLCTASPPVTSLITLLHPSRSYLTPDVCFPFIMR